MRNSLCYIINEKQFHYHVTSSNQMKNFDFFFFSFCDTFLFALHELGTEPAQHKVGPKTDFNMRPNIKFIIL
jgi:hypothetical protein